MVRVKKQKLVRNDFVCWRPTKSRVLCGIVVDTKPKIAPGSIGIKLNSGEMIYPIPNYFERVYKKIK